MIEQLRRRLLNLQRVPGIEDNPRSLALGIAAIDMVLGGGLMRGALHEIAATGESHFTAATGFVLGLTVLSAPSPRLFWITEDMALAESGAPHGAGLDASGLAPERLVTVNVAHRRDLLWTMEEALRCRTVNAVIGEMRAGELDQVAVRRLSLAAAENGTSAFLLRATPPTDASTAATRWIVGAVPSAIMHGPGMPRVAAQLVRNRRGRLGSWILEWSDRDGRFILATHTQPVATPALNRPHRQVA